MILNPVILIKQEKNLKGSRQISQGMFPRILIDLYLQFDIMQCTIPMEYGFLFLSCSLSSSLEKRVNKKVMAMFEKAEDEYNALMSKKNIIEVSFGGSVQHILTAVLAFKPVFSFIFFLD